MTPPPEKIQIGWQVFVLQHGLAEYLTRSGREMYLLRFKALCAECGEPFTAMATKTGWRTRYVKRRCDRHSQAGAIVDNLKPPIPITRMPPSLRPDKALIRQTSLRARKVAIKRQPKRIARPVSALKRRRGSLRAPELAYLD